MVQLGQPSSHSTTWRTDVRLLGLLLILVVPLRVWLLFNTEVPARDCIGFVRYSLQFESKPWHEVVKQNHQHPGYAFTVWLISMPVRAVTGNTDPATMQASAQIASALAAILLLFPMYFLGKAILDRISAFWGCLLFQCLPTSGHHLSDGVSEALFLLLVTTALVWGGYGVRRGSWRYCALSGLFCGLAYLTRPEGALVLLAIGGVLVAFQFVAAWRAPWVRFFQCGSALALAAVLSGGVYVWVTGVLTNKPSPGSILGQAAEVVAAQGPAPHGDPGTLFASLFGVFFEQSDDPKTQLGRSLRALFLELIQAFHYLAWVPVLLALCLLWKQLRILPEFWIVAAYCAVHGAILVALAMKQSYVSDRHVMPLVLFGSLLAAAGVQESIRRLVNWREAAATPLTPGPGILRNPALWAAAIVIVFLGLAAPKTAQRLHGNRAGNRAVGEWLAGQLREGDIVDDDHAWSHYYAGMVFKEGKEKPLPSGFAPRSYVVRTRSLQTKIDGMRRAEELEILRRGSIVYHWPQHVNVDQARVVVFSEPRDRAKFPWSEELSR